LVNAERYITEELKEYETKIPAVLKNTQNRGRAFEQLVAWIANLYKAGSAGANLVAQLDCLCSFTQLE
jgi:DNA mismatch repair protein MutS